MFKHCVYFSLFNILRIYIIKLPNSWTRVTQKNRIFFAFIITIDSHFNEKTKNNVYTRVKHIKGLYYKLDHEMYLSTFEQINEQRKKFMIFHQT